MQMFMDEVRFNAAGNEVTMDVFVLKPDLPVMTENAPPPPERLFQVEMRDGALVIAPLRGISSFAEDEVQREFSAILEQLKRGDVQNVVIDFSMMNYFGSNMLEAIRIIISELRQHDGRVAVCGLSPVAREILQLARFDHLLAICPALDAALGALQSEAGGRKATSAEV